MNSKPRLIPQPGEEFQIKLPYASWNELAVATVTPGFVLGTYPVGFEGEGTAFCKIMQLLAHQMITVRVMAVIFTGEESYEHAQAYYKRGRKAE